jgi:hypothetical protein
MSNTNLIKPIAMAGCCVLGDKYILGETDMNKSMWFGAAGAAGVYSAQLLAPLVPLEQYLPDGSFTDSRTLEMRILEVGGAVGVGFALNRYVLNNDPFINIQMNKLFVLAGADFLAEYIDDYMNGRPLSVFKNI